MGDILNIFHNGVMHNFDLCACSETHDTCLCDCMMSKEKEKVDPGNPAPSKRPKLSLSRKGKGRFASVSQDDLMSISKPQIPKNTEKASKWVLTNLTDWFEDYNARNPDNPCPGEI